MHMKTSHENQVKIFRHLIFVGVIWPLEAMPVWLRYFAKALPTTFAAEAMRSILARGLT